MGKALNIAADFIPGGSVAKGVGKQVLKLGLKGGGALLEGAGEAAGGALEARKQGQMDAAAANYKRDQLDLLAKNQEEQSIQNREKLRLDQVSDSRLAQNDAFAKAMKGALAKNAQYNTKPNVPRGVNLTSFNVSNPGAEGRAAGEALNAQAMQALINPQAAAPLPAYEKFQQTALPEGGTLDKILGVTSGLSTAAKIAKLIAAAQGQGKVAGAPQTVAFGDAPMPGQSVGVPQIPQAPGAKPVTASPRPYTSLFPYDESLGQ